MPYTKIWIHAVWTTYLRRPLITGNIKKPIIQHIMNDAELKGLNIRLINGWSEHLHCLLFLDPKQKLADVMQLIKGESSFWINKNNLTQERFSWQDEYYAVSVGESQIRMVRNYIVNQEEHHKRKTFDEEFKEFIRRYGLPEILG